MGANHLGSVQSSTSLSKLASREMSKEVQSGSSSRLSADETPEIVQESGKDDEQKYLTGLNLFLVTSAVTLVCFLVLLDTSIIVTVCFCPSAYNLEIANTSDVGYP